MTTPPETADSQPKISCLMVTKDRLEMLKRSVQCYCAQSYADRELVIVSDGPPACQQHVAEYVDSLKRQDIKTIATPGSMTLGAMRNLSMKHASGDILCQWDDDDICHPHRLEKQLEPLLKHAADACLLADHLHYFKDTRELFWNDWSPSGGVPGTIMYRAGLELAYAEEGPFACRQEDEHFKRRLAKRHKSLIVHGLGYLYVYLFHGGNTWQRDHHMNVVKEFALPFEAIAPYLPVLTSQWSSHLVGDLPITLVCRGGERVEFTSSPAGAVVASRFWMAGRPPARDDQ